jgi:cysteine-rich repeat protein
VTWYRVGYYSNHNVRQNSFQLILSPLPGGEVQVEMRYERCEWTTGDANGGDGGFGGSPALVGLNSGNSEDFWNYDNSLSDDVIDVFNESNTDEPGYWSFDLSAEGAVLDRWPRCGNGVVGDTYREVCDDGNTRNNDGCSARCFYEAEYFPYNRRKLHACGAGGPVGGFAGVWGVFALLVARRRFSEAPVPTTSP